MWGPMSPKYQKKKKNPITYGDKKQKKKTFVKGSAGAH